MLVPYDLLAPPQGVQTWGTLGELLIIRNLTTSLVSALAGRPSVTLGGVGGAGGCVCCKWRVVPQLSRHPNRLPWVATGPSRPGPREARGTYLDPGKAREGSLVWHVGKPPELDASGPAEAGS